MYKTLILIVLISCASAGTLKLETSPIASPIKQGDNPLDWCPECINGCDDLINGVLQVIIQVGVLDSCGELCSLVANKTESNLIGILCEFGCDIFGIKEFINLIERADLDPIYYCEVINLCPVNDHGDAKFKSFAILPNYGPMGTKFGIDYVFVSNNGTGTGEIIVAIKTVDKIPLSTTFLSEAQKPGTYGQRLVLDASPDPDCDPTQQQCEAWLPGVYNVSVTICNGQCGSQHPHTQIYDVALGSFRITQG